MEEWREIPEWETFYAVSSTGRVKRLAGSPRCKADRLVKPLRTSSGYTCVNLTRPGVPHGHYMIHRLVALAFIGKPPTALHEINHINGGKTDNHVDNLEWVTRAENIKHAYDNGLAKIRNGTSASNAKLSGEQVQQILALYEQGLKPKDIAKSFPVSARAVSDLLFGRTHQNVTLPSAPKTLKGSRVLDREKVIGIKQMLNSGRQSSSDIAKAFGVSKSTVQHIKHGRMWSEVNP